MKMRPVWSERIPMMNRWSLASIAAILGVAGAFLHFNTPGAGSQFGLAIAACLAAYLLATMHFCSITITTHEIRVGVFPYRKRIPMKDVKPLLAQALKDSDPPRLRWRKNGIGIPGFHLGWFSTSSGRPVFAAVAGKQGRVLIPTSTNHDILVSSRSAQRLVDALHSMR
jgi:hypothetical protein